MPKETNDFIIELTKSVISTFLETKEILEAPEEYPEELKQKRGVFVTLYQYDAKHEHLRGCMGLPYPEQSLIRGIIDASALACTDMRFIPLKVEDISDLYFEISVLSEPELIEVESSDEYPKIIKPGEDGLILKLSGSSGLFLPTVWKEVPDPENFLEALSNKAGLHSEAWKDENTEIYKFSTEILTGRMQDETSSN